MAECQKLPTSARGPHVGRTTTTTVVEPVPDFESLKTAAARTGFSVATFRDLVASGKLPAYRLTDKPGSAIRVRRADVDALFSPVLPDAVTASRVGR